MLVLHNPYSHHQHVLISSWENRCIFVMLLKGGQTLHPSLSHTHTQNISLLDEQKEKSVILICYFRKNKEILNTYVAMWSEQTDQCLFGSHMKNKRLLILMCWIELLLNRQIALSIIGCKCLSKYIYTYVWVCLYMCLYVCVSHSLSTH